MEVSHKNPRHCPLVIAPSSISGNGVFLTETCLSGTICCTYYDLIPSLESIQHCVHLDLHGGVIPFYTALPLILTLACTPRSKRNELLESYTHGASAPEELMQDLERTMTLFPEAYEQAARGQELMAIARAVISNHIVVVLVFDEPVYVHRDTACFRSQAGCMGKIPCSLNNPLPGESASVRLRHGVGRELDLLETTNVGGFHPIWNAATGRMVLPIVIQLVRDVAAGEELTFDYNGALTL